MKENHHREAKGVRKMKTLLTKIKNFIHEEEGASAVEYGLLVALIAVAIIGAVTMLGTNLSAMFSSVATTIQNATAS
jgi:pilus assembly protein Flp/PilA